MVFNSRTSSCKFMARAKQINVCDYCDDPKSYPTGCLIICPKNNPDNKTGEDKFACQKCLTRAFLFLEKNVH